MIETEKMRWDELLNIAQAVAPALITDVQDARDGGMQVKRYKSGQKAGSLYMSMSKRAGADYARWGKLNCGPGLEMYQLVQAVSKARWDAAYGAQGAPLHPGP